MSRQPWPLDVEQLLHCGTLSGPFRRLQPLTARRRAVRMVRALWRDTGNKFNSARRWLRNFKGTK